MQNNQGKEKDKVKISYCQYEQGLNVFYLFFELELYKRILQIGSSIEHITLAYIL